MNDATLDIIAEAAAAPLSAETEIHVQHLGGAVARVPANETAFAHRAARYFINVVGATSQVSEYESMRSLVRAFYERISSSASHGQMPNFYGDQRGDPKREFGSDNARRLAALRRRYDPGNVFGQDP